MQPGFHCKCVLGYSLLSTFNFYLTFANRGLVNYINQDLYTFRCKVDTGIMESDL